MSPLLITVSFVNLLAIAEPAAPPRIRAVRAVDAPRLDGRLDDGAWALADPSDAFTQKFPDEGRPPTEQTSVRVVYDDAAVYIGVHCDQQSSPLRRRLTRRDREAEGERSGNRLLPGSTDRITIHIGSRRDGESAFQFGINAAGVLSDGIHFDDVMFSSRWDANWEGRTAITPTGWSAELRIPLRVLRFDAEPVQDWGFNVRRFIAARQEIDEWAFSPVTEPRVVSRFGQLEALSNLPSKSAFELAPFIVGETAHAGGGSNRDGAWTRRFSVGIDAKLQPTRSTTLAAAVNPDFGQVEADQVVLNLSTYETFLPEKRPFFLEGLEFFQTPKEILYTRRIGNAPGTPAVLASETLSRPPRPTAILGALKLTGQPTRKLSAGLLAALTGDNLVNVTDETASTDGATQRLAAPMAMASAVRLKLELGRGSYVGVIATAMNRFEARDALARTTRADGSAGVLCPSGSIATAGGAIDCYRDAYVTGIDGRWRSQSGQYYATSQALLSHISGGQARTLADGTVIHAGDSDLSSILQAGKDGGHWLVGSAFNYTGRKLDYNDLGYMREQNNAFGLLDVSYRSTARRWRTRETRTGAWAKEVTDVAGNPLARDIGLYSNVTLANFWRLSAEARARPVFWSARDIYGVPARIERPSDVRYELTLRTPSSKPIIASLGAEYIDKAEGRELEGDASLFLRTFPQLELDLIASVTRAEGERRYTGREDAAPGTRFQFGRLAATGVSTTIRATYSVSPTLTLQAYTQLFLATRRYSDFAQFTTATPRPEIGLGDLQTSAAPAVSPDRQDAALNATLVLRWEYTLGSTLFLVYSRSQVPTTALLPGETARLDLGALRRAPAVDALMLKLSYWWS